MTSPSIKNEQKFFSVDSSDNGITFGQHRPQGSGACQENLTLRLTEDRPPQLSLRRRYLYDQPSSVSRQNPFSELEAHLMRLSQAGVLGTSEIFFGVQSDPFFPFHGKFDPTMKFLELFQRYLPGMLHIQTRSPLIVLAMPILKKLGSRVSVTMGVETSDDDMVARYTPELPSASDRLRSLIALRRFGIEVHIQVSPVLPYGDWKKDAKGFAEILHQHADSVSVLPLIGKSNVVTKEIRQTSLARKLTAYRQYHWLRPDSAQPLREALESLCAPKLQMPSRPQLQSRQLSIFAA